MTNYPLKVNANAPRAVGRFDPSCHESVSSRLRARWVWFLPRFGESVMGGGFVSWGSVDVRILRTSRGMRVKTRPLRVQPGSITLMPFVGLCIWSHLCRENFLARHYQTGVCMKI